MRSILPALGLLLSACGSIRPPESPTGPQVKVLSYNVNYGGPGAERALRAILAEDADLVCLQETTPAWERFLRPALEEKYPFARFHHSPGAGGLAVFSKGAVTEPVVVPSAVSWFPTWVFQAETPLGPVQVANVHLHPGVNERGSFTPSAYFSTAPAARLKETRTLHARLDPKLPTLLVGDFNEGDSGESVAWLADRGFRDALPQYDTYNNTWHWQTSVGITVSHRLDHLLHTRDLRCLDARVVRKGASDHYPVVAVFEKTAP